LTEIDLCGTKALLRPQLSPRRIPTITMLIRRVPRFKPMTNLRVASRSTRRIIRTVTTVVPSLSPQNQFARVETI